jgi:hypothetical protein
MFGQAKAAWLELKTLGLLSGEDLSRPDAADRAFAACPLRAPPAQK